MLLIYCYSELQLLLIIRLVICVLEWHNHDQSVELDISIQVHVVLHIVYLIQISLLFRSRLIIWLVKWSPARIARNEASALYVELALKKG
jgi:hypothetical protein